MSKVQNLMQEIKGLSITEVLSLVELLEQEFGVSAASMASSAVTANVDTQAQEATAKTNFKVELIEFAADKKNSVIKAIRLVKKELGLIEAKKASEALPFVLFESANKEESENAKKVLEEAGGKIKIS